MPKIIGFVGEQHIKAFKSQVKVKRYLADKLSNDYYDKENIYISGLKLGADTYFAEMVTYLFLPFHAVVSIENQSDSYGKVDRAKFNRILKMSHSSYDAWTIPKYRIKKKKQRKMREEFGTHYLARRLFLQANKLVIDMADFTIFVWNGKRVGSIVYKSINYALEKNKLTDVIHIDSRYKV